MNSRVAISALFILIAAMIIASQGTGLRKKLKLFEACYANKISAVRPIFDRALTPGNPPPAAATISPHARTVTLDSSSPTHSLGVRARHLQRFVLSLINSDHQGE